jgi:hypothetical protein
VPDLETTAEDHESYSCYSQVLGPKSRLWAVQCEPPEVEGQHARSDREPSPFTVFIYIYICMYVYMYVYV